MAIAEVAGSFYSGYANFVASINGAMNVGGASGAFIFGMVTASNGDAVASRVITGATYGGNALTVSAGTANQIGKFTQYFYGFTSLTGSNTLELTATNDSGEIIPHACAFTGVDTGTPLSGAVRDGNASSTISGTVSSATDDLVVMLIAQLDNNGDFTAGTGTTEIGPWATNFRLGCTEPGAASVTIGGTVASASTWEFWAVSLKAASGGGGSSTGAAAHYFAQLNED